MKYLKIFAFMLGVSLLASCSEKDDEPGLNTNSGATVSMGEAEISFRESAGLVKVPVVVTGERNGYVTVACEIKEYGDNPAIEEAHYLMTSQTLTIAPEDEEGYFEVKTIDDMEENDSRYFTITLTTAEGASLGAPTTTIVELKDNDKFPYDRLAGTWYIPCEDFNGAAQTLTVNFKTYEDGELGYGHAYVMTGFGSDDMEIDLGFTYNEATEEGDITLKLGQTMGEYNGFQVMLYGIDDGYIVTQGTYHFTWNEDFSVLTLVGDDPLNMAGLFNNDGWYIYEAGMNITRMTRSK